MDRANNLPPNTTGIPGVYTVDDFAGRIIENYDKETRSPRFESEHRAMISRATQAKTALERVIDLVAPTYDPALSLAIDRLVSLREQAEMEYLKLKGFKPSRQL